MGYNIEKIIRRLGTGGGVGGGGLNSREFLLIFRYFAVFLMGVAIWGIRIRPGLWGYLISVVSLKFGRCPNGAL